MRKEAVTKKGVKKNSKDSSVKGLVVVIILAIVLSLVISMIVLNISSPVENYSTDSGIINVNVVEPGNTEGKIIVNVQGGEK